MPATVLLLSSVAAAIVLLPADLGDAIDTGQSVGTTTIARDLASPIGMTELGDGRLVVALGGTGQDDDSAGAVIVDPRGGVTELVTGLASTFDSGDLAGANLVAVAPDGDELYLGNFLAGHLWTLPLDEGIPRADELPYTPDTLGVTMEPLNNVALLNPYAATFSPDGRPVVTDATGNGVAIETPDGRTEFIHRFAPVTNPDVPSTTVEPVPTGIARLDDEYLVTLFGGCPYPEGSGQLVAIDGDRGERIVADELTMPIDVVTGPDGAIWVLEFARYDPDRDCFDPQGYLPGSGRLSRIDDGELVTVAGGLDYPGAMLLADDGAIYVTQVFTGEILRLDLEVEGVTLARSEVPDNDHWLVDVAEEVGLDAVHGAFRERVSMDPVAAMGGGLCWIDVDDDGWLDLYLVNSHAQDEARRWEIGGGLPTNHLFRNDGGAFTDISADSGTNLARRGIGCVAADLDGDGHTDLFVTNDGHDVLLRNDADGTFTDVTAAAGLDLHDGWTTAAAVADLTGNGWPDLFVGAYLDLDVFIDEPLGTFPQDHPGLRNRLYLNDGPDPQTGTVQFREVAAEIGLTDAERTLGALFSDLNGDGRLELYVTNDGEPNRLYVQRPLPGGAAADDLGAGFRFEDVTDTAEVGDPFSGMGVASGDLTGDGRPELFVTNWDTELNALYLNESTAAEHRFRYGTFSVGLAGMGRDSTGWGVSFVDLDNSGFLDVLLVNGFVPIRDLEEDAELARAYGNLGSDGQPGMLRELTQAAGLRDLGPLSARGSAVADVDNDGRMDIAIATIGGAPVLLDNRAPAGNWLRLRFAAFSPGAKVLATLPDGRELVREVMVGSSYLASEDPRIHLGLGDAEQVTSIQVTWTDGARTSLTDVAAGQEVVVHRP